MEKVGDFYFCIEFIIYLRGYFFEGVESCVEMSNVCLFLIVNLENLRGDNLYKI